MNDTKKRSGAYVIASYFCNDLRDIQESRYQRYEPAVYSPSDDYYTCPAAGKKPNGDSRWNWEVMVEHLGSTIYVSRINKETNGFDGVGTPDQTGV
jgi:hypothetical protein